MMRLIMLTMMVLVCRDCLAQITLSGTVDPEAGEDLAASRVYVTGEDKGDLATGNRLEQWLGADRKFSLELDRPLPRSIRLFLEVSGAQRSCVTNLGTGGSHDLRVALRSLATPAGRRQAEEAALLAVRTAVLFDGSDAATEQFGVRIVNAQLTARNPRAFEEQLEGLAASGVLATVGRSLPAEDRVRWKRSIEALPKTIGPSVRSKSREWLKSELGTFEGNAP